MLYECHKSTWHEKEDNDDLPLIDDENDDNNKDEE